MSSDAWEEAGETDRWHFRRRQCFEDTATFDLDDCLVACAPFGGAVATARTVATVPMYKIALTLSSPAGRILGRMAWSEMSELVGLVWTHDDVLVCIFAEGSTSLIRSTNDDRPTNIEPVPIDPDHDSVRSVCVGGSVVAIMTSNLQIYVLTDVGTNDPGWVCLTRDGLPVDPTRPPQCMAVVPAEQALSGRVEVILGLTAQCGILKVTRDSADGKLVEWNNAAIVHMALHAEGQHVACCTLDLSLLVFSTDVEDNSILWKATLSSIANFLNPPVSIAFCGDCVITVWKDPCWSSNPGKATGVALVVPEVEMGFMDDILTADDFLGPPAGQGDEEDDGDDDGDDAEATDHEGESGGLGLGLGSGGEGKVDGGGGGGVEDVGEGGNPFAAAGSGGGRKQSDGRATTLRGSGSSSITQQQGNH